MAHPLPLNGDRLRLVEVGLDWPPESFLRLKLTSLAARGFDVVAGSTDISGAPAEALAGVRPMQLPAVDSTALSRWRMRHQLTRLRPDVLHYEWLTVAASHVRLLDAWRGPLVVSCRGSDLPVEGPAPNRARASALEALFARADAIHCVSDATRRDALAFGLPPEKACLIPAAVDVGFFKPAPDRARTEAGFRIVSVGALRWLKGHEYAMLVLAELVHLGIPATLDLLGGDPPSNTLERGQQGRILHTAHDLGIGDRVRMHGHVSPAEVRAQFERADAFLHTSLSEGLPNVVLEAMACGVPVVATDVGGTREAVRDGIDGVVVPPRDPDAAAAALAALWRDTGLRKRLGRAGRARVEAEFTLERQTQQWVDVYERVTADP